MTHFKESGLILTNYHPVLHQNEWRFPIDIIPSERMHVDNYYNFVMEDSHSMSINGMFCITLGHGLTEGVLEHEYLGTTQVIDNLKMAKGWEDG